MKNQKGITLVALVITIVVLLILAGVTISMVMGDNGVLSNSQKAKEESAKGTSNDSLSSALSSISTNYYSAQTAEVGDAVVAAMSANQKTLNSATTLSEILTSESNHTALTGELAAQMQGYNEFTVEKTADGYVIKFEEEKAGGYKFKATISNTLTIKKFEFQDPKKK